MRTQETQIFEVIENGTEIAFEGNNVIFLTDDLIFLCGGVLHN